MIAQRYRHMAKKVLLTTFTFPPHANGVAHVVYEQAVGLARQGFQVSIAAGCTSTSVSGYLLRLLEDSQSRLVAKGRDLVRRIIHGTALLTLT